MIDVRADGAYDLTADDGRTLTIPAGTAPADRASRIAAFFGPTVVPVPEKVSQTQFMRAATSVGLVTAAQAEAYLGTGTLPDFAARAVATIKDPAERADARLKAIGATEFYRADSLFDLLIAADVATAAQVDDLFRLAGTLT